MKPETVSKDVEREILQDVVGEYLHWRKVNPHIKGGENYLKRLAAAQTKAGDVEAMGFKVRFNANVPKDEIWLCDTVEEKVVGRITDAISASPAIAAMPQASEWLPISSAPQRFMTEILAYDRDWCAETPCIVSWDVVKERWVNPDREDNHEIHPTHWMPLPAAPRGLAGEGLCTKS